MIETVGCDHAWRNAVELKKNTGRRDSLIGFYKGKSEMDIWNDEESSDHAFDEGAIPSREGCGLSKTIFGSNPIFELWSPRVLASSTLR